MTVLLASGCGNISQPAHRSWPKPVVARSIAQFSGLYRNHSLDHGTGKAAKDGDELFERLTSQAEPRGSHLEIRPSHTGESVRLRLLDDAGGQIAFVTLRRGINYSLSEGSLSLRHDSLGWEGDTGNIGAGLHHSGFQLLPTSTGGLLGRYTEGSAALVAYLVPTVSKMELWMFWPKLSP